MNNVSPADTVGVKLNMKIAQIYDTVLQHWHKLTDTQIALLLFLAAIVASIVCYAVVALVLQRWHARKGLAEKGLHRHVPYLKAPLRAFIPGVILASFCPF